MSKEPEAEALDLLKRLLAKRDLHIHQPWPKRPNGDGRGWMDSSLADDVLWDEARKLLRHV